VCGKPPREPLPVTSPDAHRFSVFHTRRVKSVIKIPLHWDGNPVPHREGGNFGSCPFHCKALGDCCGVRKYGWTDRDAVWRWLLWVQWVQEICITRESTSGESIRRRERVARIDKTATRLFVKILWPRVIVIIIIKYQMVLLLASDTTPDRVSAERGGCVVHGRWRTAFDVDDDESRHRSGDNLSSYGSSHRWWSERRGAAGPPTQTAVWTVRSQTQIRRRYHWRNLVQLAEMVMRETL